MDLHERLRRFSLELHPEKTLLIEFGMVAPSNASAPSLSLRPLRFAKPRWEPSALAAPARICAGGGSGQLGPSLPRSTDLAARLRCELRTQRARSQSSPFDGREESRRGIGWLRSSVLYARAPFERRPSRRQRRWTASRPGAQMDHRQTPMAVPRQTGCGYTAPTRRSPGRNAYPSNLR